MSWVKTGESEVRAPRALSRNMGGATYAKFTHWKCGSCSAHGLTQGASPPSACDPHLPPRSRR